MNIPKYATDFQFKIPLAKNTKIPIKGFRKEAKIDYDDDYFKEHDGNWGFYCGIGNKIVVIDFDCRKEKKNKFLEVINKHNTYIIESKNGFHFYYEIEGEFPRISHNKNVGYTENKFYSENKTKYPNLLNGIDFQGLHGLVVGENSTIKGWKYKRINNKPIKAITRKEYDIIFNELINKFPPKIRDGFIKIFNGKTDPNELAIITDKKEFVYWKFAYIEALFFCRVEPEDLFDGMARMNKGFNKSETIKQINSTSNSPRGKFPMLPETYNKYFPDEDEEFERVGENFTGKLTQKSTIFEEIKVERELEKFYKLTKIQSRKIIKKHQDKIKAYIHIVDEIKAKYDIITLTDSNEVLIKASNIYRPDVDGKIETLISEHIRDYNLNYSGTDINIYKLLKAETSFNREKFCYNPHLINFKNGYFNIRTEEFNKPDDKIFPFEIPHKFKGNLGDYKCPKYKKALKEWLYGKGSVFNEDDMFEMIGYCMTLDISQKKAFMIYGKKDTGKTQNLAIILYIIGNDNYTQIELQRLDRDQFGTVGLEFRMVCVDDDLPSDKLKGASKFKKMVGGLRKVGAEKKGGNQYSFINTIRFIFNCNEIPEAYNPNDEAFFVRWILCNFKNVFDEDSDDTKKDFYKTIIDDKEEVQGIIHQSILGAIRLHERGSFRPEVRKNTMKVWQMLSDPLYDFIVRHCLDNYTKTINTNEFREFFNKFLLLNDKGEPYTQIKLNKEMEKLGFFRKRDGNHQFYIGITIRSDFQSSLIEVWDGNE